jgi:hypothetical protein
VVRRALARAAVAKRNVESLKESHAAPLDDSGAEHVQQLAIAAVSGAFASVGLPRLNDADDTDVLGRGHPSPPLSVRHIVDSARFGLRDAQADRVGAPGIEQVAHEPVETGLDGRTHAELVADHVVEPYRSAI